MDTIIFTRDDGIWQYYELQVTRGDDLGGSVKATSGCKNRHLGQGVHLLFNS